MITLHHAKTFQRLMAVSIAGSLLAGCASEHRGGSGYNYYSSTTRTSDYGGQSAGASASAQSSDQNSSSQNISGSDQTTTIPLFKEELRVGKRTVEAGSVRLQKTVKTETVNQPIELREEIVTVDRQPANGQSQNQMAQNDQRLDQPFQQGQVEIRLQREEPVVEKQIVPAGSIVVQKRSQTQQRNIQNEVRRDDIVVAKSGDSQNINISANVQSSDAQGSAGMGGTADISSESSGSASSGEITDLNRLTPANASQCEGKSVRLSGVQVQQAFGDRLIALRGSETPVYVQLRQPQNLRAGQTVTITGTVKSRSQTSTQSELAQQEQEALRGQPFYIEAQNIQANQ
jgi:uncharacterized protein (TIGR02271 family)